MGHLPNDLTMMKLIEVRDILTKADSAQEMQSAMEWLSGLVECENRYIRGLFHNVDFTVHSTK